MKKFCETHRLYYTDELCPFCQKDKFDKLNKENSRDKQINKPTKKQNKNEEITQDLLLKLKDHFKKQ